jgi:uncharacterized protein with FMN-binding domain
MLKILLYILGILAVIIVASLLSFNMAGRNAGKYIGEFQPRMSQIKDGQYEGEYSTIISKVGAKISFKIKDGELIRFQFEKLYGTIGYGAPQNIKAGIDQKEDLNFDSISGATVTSNFAKAAIKNALEKGPVE